MVLYVLKTWSANKIDVFIIKLILNKQNFKSNESFLPVGDTVFNLFKDEG